MITRRVDGIEPVVIDHGRGATVTDIEGRDYLDCFGGISAVNVDHCNEQVNAAALANPDFFEVQNLTGQSARKGALAMQRFLHQLLVKAPYIPTGRPVAWPPGD